MLRNHQLDKKFYIYKASRTMTLGQDLFRLKISHVASIPPVVYKSTPHGVKKQLERCNACLQTTPK